MAETHRKEIGIRKMLGASAGSIAYILTKEFMILTLISLVIATSVAWWAMNEWLANYVYRTDILWWLLPLQGYYVQALHYLQQAFRQSRRQRPIR